MAGKTKKTTKVKKKRKSDGAGRPPVDIDHEQLKQMAMMQCTQEEMAGFFGCARSTIGEYIQKHPDALAAYENGKASGLISLRRSLFNAAKRGSDRVLVHLSKVYLKNIEVSREEQTGIGGDPIRHAHGVDRKEYKEAREEILKEY